MIPKVVGDGASNIGLHSAAKTEFLQEGGVSHPLKLLHVVRQLWTAVIGVPLVTRFSLSVGASVVHFRCQAASERATVECSVVD